MCFSVPNMCVHLTEVGFQLEVHSCLITVVGTGLDIIKNAQLEQEKCA